MAPDYLEELRSGFRRALDAGVPQHEAVLSVDGDTIRLVFAGDALTDAVLPALARLAAAGAGGSSAAAPTMTVELWDSASAGFPPPPPPWTSSDSGRLGAVQGHNDADRKTVVDPESGTISIADLRERRAVVWVPAVARLPSWWRAVPLRMILDWALARPGRHLVHAGAVGSRGRGVLLAGPGHAGKSTVAAACAQSGMDFVSDDYLLLSAGAPPVAHGLYGTARVDRRSLAGLPEIARQIGDPGTGPDKVLLDLHAMHPDRLPARLAIEAVVVPRFVGGAKARLEAISPGAALRALAPSTIFQLPDNGAPALGLIAEVLRQVPSYELCIGDDVRDVPERVATLVAPGA